MITVRGPTSRLGDDCLPEIEVTGTPRRALVLGANHGCRVHRVKSNTSMVASTVLADPVNVALNKPVEVNITCGTFGEETYYEHTDIFQLPSRRRLKLCTNMTHVASAMVDGNPATWWQSMSRSNLMRAGYGVSDDSPQAIITVDLLQVCNQFSSYFNLQYSDQKGICPTGRISLSITITQYQIHALLSNTQFSVPNTHARTRAHTHARTHTHTHAHSVH